MFTMMPILNASMHLCFMFYQFFFCGGGGGQDWRPRVEVGRIKSSLALKGMLCETNYFLGVKIGTYQRTINFDLYCLLLV